MMNLNPVSGWKNRRLIFSLSEQQKWTAISVIQTLVVIALGVWPVFFKEAFLPLRVRYSNVSEEMTVLSSSTRSVEVLVRGLKFRINEAKKGDLDYILDLSNARKGVSTFEFNRKAMRLPKGISLIRSNNSTLIVKLDHKIRKKLPVEAVFSGKPGSGYVLLNTEIEPSSAWFEGPRSILEPLREMKTKPLEIGNADEPLKIEAVLDLPEDVSPVHPVSRVLANVRIDEKIILKDFKSVPVAGRPSNYDYSITPSSVELKVKGPFNDLDKLLPEDIEVFIDLSASGPGVYKRYAVIRLPVKMILMDVKPEGFTVKINRTWKKGAKKEATRAVGR